MPYEQERLQALRPFLLARRCRQQEENLPRVSVSSPPMGVRRARRGGGHHSVEGLTEGQEAEERDEKQQNTIHACQSVCPFVSLFLSVPFCLGLF